MFLCYMNNMVAVYEELFSFIDEKQTVVMPTEQAARALMLEYVKSRGKAISFSSAIAFDTFKEILFQRDSSLKPVDGLTRLLFSKNFIDEYADDLCYFIPNKKYPEIRERMVYFIASALPALEGEDSLGIAVKKDVQLIKNKYEEFLENGGYYEPSYMEGLENRLTKPYILAFSSSSMQMASFYSRLKDKSNIQLYNIENAPLCSLNVYENEKQEIRNTFLLIKELIKRGETLDRIAISVSGYERLLPYLERESYLFDIPLSFMLGKSALSYPAGKIFSLIDEIYSSSYDLESLKKLLLNPTFPLRDEEGARRFILNAIEMGITGRDDKDRYSLADVKFIYHDLSHYIDSINETSDPDYLINQIKSLFQKLLLDEQFSGNEEDERVLSYLMDSLMHFSDKVKELRGLGLLNNNEKLFSLFLRCAQSTIYVPKEKTQGVRVYPLSEACGIYIPNHFVLALNEDEGRKVYKSGNYLSDYEILNTRDEVDITHNMLLGYAALSDNIVFSSSLSTYNGYSLPLTDFSEKVTPSLLKDSIADEHIILKNKSIYYDLYPIQKRSYFFALNKSLGVKKDTEDMAGSLKVQWPSFSKNTRIFSSSQIDKYTRCPFLYAVDYVFQMSKERKYEVSTYPAMEIGSRLHKVIELYFKNGKGDENKKVEEYLNLVLDLWQRRLSLDRGQNEVPLKKDVIALSDEMRMYVFHRYKDGLVNLLKSLNERGDVFSLEEKVEGMIDTLNFTSFLDCVIDLGESVDIIDFKTTSAPSDSSQFDIYRVLYEKERGKSVRSASYAIIRDGKIKRPVALKEDDEVIDLVDDVASGLGNGDFHGVNSPKSCQSCPAKGICRRRFFVR